MAKYHISDDGNPRVCRASKNPCRFGGSAAHYASKDEAREAYEVTQEALAHMEAGLTEREAALQDYFLSFGLLNRNQFTAWEKQGVSRDELNRKMYEHIKNTAPHSARTLKAIDWSDEDFAAQVKSSKPAKMKRVMSKEIAPQDIDQVFDTLLERNFFVNERQKSYALEELKTGQGEHWYSNGVAEFKIFNEYGGFRLYNFRNIQSKFIDDFFTEEA